MVRLKRNILLTFDYELFLGNRSGSVEKCLLAPTSEILKILNKHKAVAIFFVDTTYLVRLEQESKTNQNARNDFKRIKNQLLEVARKGHYLYHHLHPHWLDARYIEYENQWDLSNSKRFSLASLSKQDINTMFEYSSIFLNAIYEEAKESKVPEGFRAGGLFIEPFDVVKPFLKNFGIKYEFSVVPGDRKLGQQLAYDFSTCPQSIYCFEDNICQPVEKGSFLEFPITKIRIKGFRKLLNGLFFRLTKNQLNYKALGDGLSVSSDINESGEKKKLLDYFNITMSISVELMNRVLFSEFLNVVSRNKFVHFLSHPKLISLNSLEVFDDFLCKCQDNFDLEFDFKKMIKECQV